MSSLGKLYNKHDLAARYGMTPRTVVRMAREKRWPSTKPGREYLWTDAMVQWIDSQREQWPDATPVEREPKRQIVKAPQPTPRRNRPLQTAPMPGSNVRPLVAKPRRKTG